MSISPLSRHSSTRNDVHRIALLAITAGISVVPIRTDGTKHPSLYGWREYQQRRATATELARWFCMEQGIAFITGAVSGNLEALDFDCYDTFKAWRLQMHGDPILSALYEHIASGYLEATPAGGRHLLYRCAVIEGNQKLASRPDGEKRKTLIETRGEGGLIIVAPSRGGVHPSGKPYRVVRGGVSSIRTITAQQRDSLFSVARMFDEVPPASSHPVSLPRLVSPFQEGNELRPGDLFNQTASWEDILIPHGWQLVRTIGTEGYWRRPGKDNPGISATTNHQGHDLLYVFSTSTVFETERGYTKFQAYTLLNHQGDFSAAARTLAEVGYSTRGRLHHEQHP